MINLSIELMLRILLSAVLGGLVGFEREKNKKPAGLRTNMLVCIGSCLFTIISVQTFSMDPARVAAGIVTGIGFLGAGSILGGKDGRKHVEGLTTAATLWVMAAIGMAVGVGEYMLAVVASFVVFAILVSKGLVKHYYNRYVK